MARTLHLLRRYPQSLSLVVGRSLAPHVAAQCLVVKDLSLGVVLLHSCRWLMFATSSNSARSSLAAAQVATRRAMVQVLMADSAFEGHIRVPIR